MFCASILSTGGGSLVSNTSAVYKYMYKRINKKIYSCKDFENQLK